MANLPTRLALFYCVAGVLLGVDTNACRVGSEKLKTYARKSIERILTVKNLESFYWPVEPLDSEDLSKVTGLDITLAETRFQLDRESNSSYGINGSAELLRDIFVTCTAGKDRSYTLAINLELDNPFKALDLRFQEDGNQESAIFRIRLPRSSFLIQLNQRINYDECLDVGFVQLAPNLSYELECVSCSEAQHQHLIKTFNKRMSKLDSGIDSLLSEKLLLGLKALLSEKRLDLDLYLN